MNAARQRQYRFSLRLNQAQLMRYYQGSASAIQVTSHCGRRLQFPASRLRPFMTHTGIEGSFVLTIDTENRFVDLKKIS